MNREEIRDRNDAIRKNWAFDDRNKLMLTRAVINSPHRQEIMLACQNYNDFNSDVDPHGEHDFGSFDVGGETWWFKIDYYDENLEFHGHDRITLTIMHASEY